MPGFHEHLKDAISINEIRKKQYVTKSQGKTRFLSNLLIGSEHTTLPIARYYDRQGKKYNDIGIEIVKSDFVPMDIADFDKEVDFRKQYTSIIIGKIKEENKALLCIIPRKFYGIEELHKVYEKTLKWYTELEEIENNEQVNFAMLKHILESIGFIAKNGISYAQESNNETINLSGSLINLHKIAVRKTLLIDKMANKFHQDNIGIIVNDMPKIHF